MSAGEDRGTPWWAWIVVAVLLGAGGLVGLVVLLLALYTASAPDCAAVTAAGKSAQRLTGFGLAAGVLIAWGGAAVAAVRARVPVLGRMAIAALPLVLVPLLLVTAERALERRLDAVGDTGSGSCF